MTDHTRFWSDNILPKSTAERAVGQLIRSCPFCGSGCVGLWTGPAFYVTCGECGTDGPRAETKAHGDLAGRMAVNLWNQRHAAYGPQGSG